MVGKCFWLMRSLLSEDQIVVSILCVFLAYPLWLYSLEHDFYCKLFVDRHHSFRKLACDHQQLHHLINPVLFKNILTFYGYRFSNYDELFVISLSF